MYENIRKTSSGYIAIKDGIEYHIPETSGNRQYQLIMEDIASGADVIDLTVVNPDPLAELIKWRETATCSPMQGILALGETEWAKIEAYRDTSASWAEKIIINNASEWRRNSQDIQFFAYLLGYTDEQLDDLFVHAASIVA